MNDAAFAELLAAVLAAASLTAGLVARGHLVVHFRRRPQPRRPHMVTITEPPAGGKS